MNCLVLCGLTFLIFQNIYSIVVTAYFKHLSALFLCLWNYIYWVCGTFISTMGDIQTSVWGESACKSPEYIGEASASFPTDS